MSRLAAIGAINLVALATAILHAYKLNGNFYASSVYFAQSRLSMIILGSWGLYCLFLCAKVVKDLFLGPLRIIELEHLNEYSWITLSETFLAMTIFKDEIDSSFIFAFAFLMTIRVFHWILRDRIEYMEQILRLPANFMKKIGTLLASIFVVDIFMIVWHVTSVLKRGPSMSILFANEYALTAVSMIASIVRFCINCKDALHPEHPYEQRSLTLFYLDFGVDLAKLVIYFVFIVVISISYGIPVHILRDLYLTVVSFIRRARDMINYHTVMSTIDSRYPDVTESELEALPDRTCIICREEMFDGAKRLPCGHCFHFKCLKSWLERQQVCPTCRKSILKNDPPQTPMSTATQPTPQPSLRDAPDSTLQQTPIQNREYPRATSPALIPNINSPSFASVRSNPSPQFMMEPAAAFVVLPRENLDDDERTAAQLSPVIEAELERFGRRSPLRRTLSMNSDDLGDFSPRSDNHLLSSLSSQIEYVEELLQEHQTLLRKLRSAEQLIRKSTSKHFSESSDDENGDEKAPLD